jgi:valyl-tRNA synthetase
MVKARAYAKDDDAGRRSALYTLHQCFSTILLLLAPITPFITEELWTKIYSENNGSIHLENMYSRGGLKKENENTDIAQYDEMLKYTNQIIAFNSHVWNKKKDTISRQTGKPLSLKDPIDIEVPKEIELFKRDLIAMHNLITK